MIMKMKKLSVLAAMGLALSCLLSACSESGGGGNHHGTTVVVSGSTSVQPFAEVLAAEYEHLFTEGKVDVQGGGSTTGITSAMKGISDIGMSSRAMKGDELELHFVTIAQDGLALVVHPDNPVKDLTLEQVRAVYMREITRWSEFGDEYDFSFLPKNDDIHVVTREEGSGSRGAFEELVMSWKTKETVTVPDFDVQVPVCNNCEETLVVDVSEDEDEETQELDEKCECGGTFEYRTITISGKTTTYDKSHSEEIHGKTIALNTNGAIRQFVAENPNAIGYISLGTVVILDSNGNPDTSMPPVTGVAINGVEPSLDNVNNGTYKLFRPFIFVIAEDPSPSTIAFIDFVFSDDGQEMLTKKGLVGAPNNESDPDACAGVQKWAKMRVEFGGAA